MDRHLKTVKADTHKKTETEVIGDLDRHEKPVKGLTYIYLESNRRKILTKDF